MAYKLNYESAKSGNYSKLRFTERVGERNDYIRKREEEREKFRPEMVYRKDLNSTIAKYIELGYPKEELTKAVQAKFPQESPERIEYLIDYWIERYQGMLAKIEEILGKYQSDSIKQKRNIGLLYRRYGIFKATIKSRLEDKLKEIGEER